MEQAAEGRQTTPGNDAEGGGPRTRARLPSGDLKYSRKGRRSKVYLIRCPFPFTRSTRSALQSEEYGHPRGHLSCGPVLSYVETQRMNPPTNRGRFTGTSGKPLVRATRILSRMLFPNSTRKAGSYATSSNNSSRITLTTLEQNRALRGPPDFVTVVRHAYSATCPCCCERRFPKWRISGADWPCM